MNDHKEHRSAWDVITGYVKDFAVLKENRSEYWGIQFINFLDCTIFFALITVASVFLSKELGFNDKDAGYVVTLFTSGTTLSLLFSGVITDWLGIRRSIVISMVAMILLRSLVAFTGAMADTVTVEGMSWNGIVYGMQFVPTMPFRGVIVAVALTLMAPFMAMMQTVFQAANKRFTTTKSRSAGFTLWYLFMNIGAMMAGFSIDIVHKVLDLPYAHIFTMGAVLGVLSLIVMFLMVRNEDQLYGEGEEREAAEPDDGKPKERRSPWVIIKQVVAESAFWKLLVLIGLTLGVRAVFAYFYLLMPKYWLRTIGEDANWGTLNAINPFLIVIGLILFIPIANKFNLFKMLTRGALLSGFSLFLMVVPWQLYSGDIATAHYIMAILFIVVLSIGEIIWSPKLSEYTATVAPKGQEGTYLGFTMIPWFLAKTIVSLLSGHMLTRWCPEGIGEQMVAGTVGFWDSPAAMWLILGVFAVSGCVVAIFLGPWFTKGQKWSVEEQK